MSNKSKSLAIDDSSSDETAYIADRRIMIISKGLNQRENGRPAILEKEGRDTTFHVVELSLT